MKIIYLFGVMYFVLNTSFAADIEIGPNGCSLKDAIRSANADALRGNCVAGSGFDTIIAPDGWQVIIDQTLPDINSDMKITTATTDGLFTISGDERHRIFVVNGNNTDFTLARVRLFNGFKSSLAGGGGAMKITDATVNIIDSDLVANAVIDAKGGAINIKDGVLNLINSGFFENYNDGLEFFVGIHGGAVYAKDSTINVTDSTFRGNGTTASIGASLYMDGGELNMSGSLVNEQDTGVNGFGAVINIKNSTFQPLQAVYPITLLRFEDSYFVNLNHITSTSTTLVYDSILSISNSIYGECFLDNTSVLFDVNNIRNSGNPELTSNCLSGDEQLVGLLPLQDNGGHTHTRGLSFNSPAINTGDPTYCIAVDQRGEQREGLCDVGAFEATGFADVETNLVLSAAEPFVGNQDLIANLIVRNNGPGVATAVELELDTDDVFVNHIDSAQCSAFPCIISLIGAGQQVVIPLNIALGNPINSPFSIVAEASSTTGSTHTDPDESTSDENNVFSISHVINRGADVSVQLDLATPAPYFIDQTITYVATIANSGLSSANNIVLDLMPFGLNLLGFENCSSIQQSSCVLSSLLNGGDREVVISAKITSPQFNAIATVHADEIDVESNNNTDDQQNSGAISDADIKVAMVLNQVGPHYSNQFLEFDITIETQDDPATNIQLWSEFPGSEFVGIDICQSIPCVIEQMDANSETTLSFRFLAPAAYPGVVDSLTHRVYVSPGQNDPDQSNNEVIINKQLMPAADIGVELNLITEPPYYVGQEVQYDLTVLNRGINDATNISVEHSPVNLTLLWVASQSCQSLNCDIDELDLFQNENMTLVYQINDVGIFDLSANAFGNEIDELPSNNTDDTGNDGLAELIFDDLIFEDGFD